MYCVRTFERCADIDIIAIVAPALWERHLCDWLGEYGIGKFKVYAQPGRTRQHSIFNGLLSLRSHCPANVIIHDAARPLVTEEDISDCIRAFDGYDGATPAVRLSDTVYQCTDGETITALLNRDELLAGLTPEGYDFTKYLAAHEALGDTELGTIRGSSEIAFKAGMKIHLYKGNPQNIKITTQAA
jgi:2-C-methyl-D-erythritol 4-phosphate cytidylyltransferase